eukprot:SAG25_NODE_1487_length_2919_cov_2.764539_2_plen_68_part_00
MWAAQMRRRTRPVGSSASSSQEPAEAGDDSSAGSVQCDRVGTVLGLLCARFRPKKKGMNPTAVRYHR